MLNITSSQPVAWPSAPSAAVSPVTATTAVTPVQGSARDTQTGLGQGRERPAPEALRRGGAQPAEGGKERTAPDAAPLLPRESPDSPDGQTPAESTEAKAERDKAAEQAAEKALKQQLQDVLSNVWKASAAVVDVVLGREALSTEAQPDSATELGGVAPVQTTGPGAVTATRPEPAALLGAGRDAANDDLPPFFETRTTQDVVAYDAHGNSSWAPLEAGSLISRRV